MKLTAHKLKTLILLISPLITLIAVEYLQQSFFPFPVQGVLNYIIYALPGVIIFWIFNSIRAALLIPNIFFLLFGLINHYVIIYRNASLQPWDLMAAETAINVLPAMTFKIDASVVCAGIWLAAILILCIFMSKSPRRKSYVFPLFTTTAALVLIVGMVSPSVSRDDFWDTLSASRRNGFALNFITNLRILHNPPPDNYDIDQLITLKNQDREGSDAKPDIIVIMNEAFADLSMYDDLNTNRDPLEFFHNLRGAYKGELVVSVFGGGTCNTEYDFLTGNSTAMLRPGSYPLQQFVSRKSPSVASTLKAQGYQTHAIHPYHPNGWNRSRAYPLLDFDEFISIDAFNGAEIIRQFVSDRAAYDKIKEITRSTDAPAFIFCVTMQNHLGYDISYENFKEDITFPGSDIFPQTRQYLSLIEESDDALEELIGYYQSSTKPTYILFFGDHQPAIEDEFYRSFTDNSPFSRYTVPFFIWSNQGEIDTGITRISANYLAPLLLKTAGLKTTAYDDFLLELVEKVPVISSQGLLDRDGNYFKLTDKSPSDVLLNIYHALQYNQVFDKTNRLDQLFYIK